MPDLTGPFSKAFDAIRLVTQAQRPGQSQAALKTVSLFFDNNSDAGQVKTGWFAEEVASEEAGGRSILLHITDRNGYEFLDVVFFEFGGYRYERADEPNPPVNNPREWIWRLRPVGVVQ